MKALYGLFRENWAYRQAERQARRIQARRGVDPVAVWIGWGWPWFRT